jgi:hypothetical protein
MLVLFVCKCDQVLIELDDVILWDIDEAGEIEIESWGNYSAYV